MAFSTDPEMVEPEGGHLNEFIGWDGSAQDGTSARASGFMRVAAVWRSVNQRLQKTVGRSMETGMLNFLFP